MGERDSRHGPGSALITRLSVKQNKFRPLSSSEGTMGNHDNRYVLGRALLRVALASVLAFPPALAQGYGSDTETLRAAERSFSTLPVAQIRDAHDFFDASGT